MNRRNFLTFTYVSLCLTNNLLANNQNIVDDIILSNDELVVLKDIKNRLKRLQRFIGFGNFNIVSFNDALFYARNYSAIGRFTKDELNLIDKLFYETPAKYGFYGDKTSFNINNKIVKKDLKKIPRTGHYLFKGTPLNNYKRLKKDIGNNIYLTSGVRNVVKQLYLYSQKIYSCKGNITQASHHIAPPAYSYHTISDFDVGKKGWGYKNFTSDFAKTDEFYKMTKLNYIDMRYTKKNQDGVRFEPWHVKII